MAAATGERESNVSNHLARLRAADLVRASRHEADARWVYYSDQSVVRGPPEHSLREWVGNEFAVDRVEHRDLRCGLQLISPKPAPQSPFLVAREKSKTSVDGAQQTGFMAAVTN